LQWPTDRSKLHAQPGGNEFYFNADRDHARHYGSRHFSGYGHRYEPKYDAGLEIGDVHCWDDRRLGIAYIGDDRGGRFGQLHV
jgi:hypothetical protein